METKLKYVCFGMVMLPFTVFAQEGGLKVQPGTHLNVSSNAAKIVLSKDANFHNNGIFTHGEGEVIFSGNDDQEIRGTSTSIFHDLTINKTAGDLIAVTDIEVENNLKLAKGQLDLQNATVSLGTTGSIVDENADNKIYVSNPDAHTGIIIRTATIDNTEIINNPGNIGIGLKPTANLGEVTIIRGHLRQQGTNGYFDNYSVSRYFDINPTNNDIETELEFYFQDIELHEHLSTDLIVYRYMEDNGNPYWKALTGPINAGENNHITFTTPGFSKFTLGSENSPLPIELLSFDVKWLDNRQHEAVINWTTASETNNDYFVVERSQDAMNWEAISTTQGAGTVSYNTQYETKDKHPLVGISYYRLKQVDYDGTTTHSQLRELFKGKEQIDLVMFPNPATDVIIIRFDSNTENSLTQIIITDKLGRIVSQTMLRNEMANSIITIDVSHLKTGIYNIRIARGVRSANQKIVVSK